MLPSSSVRALRTAAAAARAGIAAHVRTPSERSSTTPPVSVPARLSAEAAGLPAPAARPAQSGKTAQAGRGIPAAPPQAPGKCPQAACLVQCRIRSRTFPLSPQAYAHAGKNVPADGGKGAVREKYARLAARLNADGDAISHIQKAPRREGHGACFINISSGKRDAARSTRCNRWVGRSSG